MATQTTSAVSSMFFIVRSIRSFWLAAERTDELAPAFFGD